jgi:hypothetical protein
LQTTAGERLYWTLHLERGCNEVPAGGKYSRDLHLCSEPGCEKSHSMQNHKWQTTADIPIFHMPTSTFRSKSLLVGPGTSALRFLLYRDLCWHRTTTSRPSCYGIER